MPVEFTSKVMKVGNSLVMVLPKAVCDGFKIDKGAMLLLKVSDDGIYIPLRVESQKDIQRLR